MSKAYSRILGILAAGVLLAASASAAAVTWDINGDFNDGGTISGSFVYDADLNQFSSIDVTTSGGSVLAGADYTLANPCCGGVLTDEFLLFVTTTGDLTGTPVLALDLDSPMTDAGGTIDLVSNNNALTTPWDTEASCWSSDTVCGGAAAPYRYVVDGDVSTAPEPGTFLLALPLCALFFGMRRQFSERLGGR